jgi:tetratricopeptide (TPR) repeat protein
MTMIGASLLPWLVDPLGERFSAWALPIDLGWQFHSGLFNYGVLSLVCALYAFLIAFRTGKALRAAETGTAKGSVSPGKFIPAEQLTLAGLLCLVPMLLFFLQYLFIDMSSINDLARHQMQATLIRLHLSYGSATPFVTINTATFDPLNLHSRLAVVLNNLAPGLFLPLISAALLFVTRVFWPRTWLRRHPAPRARLWWVMGAALLLAVLLGRGPAALASNFQARHALSVGDYTKALTWLDTARAFNPELDQMASYHIERGQAWYYLRPGEENEETMLYLSSTYQQQKDYLASYQELLIAWNRYNKDAWVRDAVSTTLTSLAEQNKPLAGIPNNRLNNDNPSLPWLQELVQIDPDNTYGHYMIGRILYEEHNYTASISEMQSVLDLAQETNFRSVAYTYLGLDSEMLGNASQARTFLFQAVDLDPGYHNNTARQELSGMR